MKRRFLELMLVVSLVAIFMAMHAHQRQGAKSEPTEDAVSSVVDTVCTPARPDISSGKEATPEPGESPTVSTNTRPGNTPNETTKLEPGKRTKPEPENSPNANARKTPIQNGEYPRFTFRFSSEGGCYADSNYYFEAQSGPEGAKWKAVVMGCVDWSGLMEREPKQPHKILGNFETEGTFSPQEATAFVSRLVDHHALDLVPGTFGVGPPDNSIYLKCDSGANKVINFQARVLKPGAPPDPNATFLDYCDNSFVTRAGEDAQKRFDQGLPPDSQPPHAPGPNWPLNSASLFNNG